MNSNIILLSVILSIVLIVNIAVIVKFVKRHKTVNEDIPDIEPMTPEIMADHKNKMLEEIELELLVYKDTLVIDSLDQVSCLRGIDEDEDDYYWVFDSKDDVIIKQSCVTGWIPLKGYIPNKDYEQLVNTWNMNHEKNAI